MKEQKWWERGTKSLKRKKMNRLHLKNQYLDIPRSRSAAPGWLAIVIIVVIARVAGGGGRAIGTVVPSDWFARLRAIAICKVSIDTVALSLWALAAVIWIDATHYWYCFASKTTLCSSMSSISGSIRWAPQSESSVENKGGTIHHTGHSDGPDVRGSLNTKQISALIAVIDTHTHDRQTKCTCRECKQSKEQPQKQTGEVEKGARGHEDDSWRLPENVCMEE